MASVTNCDRIITIRSPTDFSGCELSSFEGRGSGFESKMRARFGIESMHGTGRDGRYERGIIGSRGVTGLKNPIGDPCIITILLCARIQLLDDVVGRVASSETQGQIEGARESLNGRKNMARRKVKNGEKSPWGQCLTRPVPNGRRRSAF